jgi:hypothetical protein
MHCRTSLLILTFTCVIAFNAQAQTPESAIRHYKNGEKELKKGLLVGCRGKLHSGNRAQLTSCPA